MYLLWCLESQIFSIHISIINCQSIGQISIHTKLDCHKWEDVVTPISFEELLVLVTSPFNSDPSTVGPTIYSVPLSQRQEDFETSFSLLTQPEKQRADRFRHEGARRQYVIGHGIVHLLLKWYLENSYSTIEFKETKHHKPYILLTDCSRPLEYNLSHCEDYIAVAFGSTSQGVDIENIRPLENLEGISRQVFTEREIETVFATNELATQTKTFSNSGPARKLP